MPKLKAPTLIANHDKIDININLTFSVIEIITHANDRVSVWPVRNYQELNLRPSHNKL